MGAQNMFARVDSHPIYVRNLLALLDIMEPSVLVGEFFNPIPVTISSVEALM